jgi:ubiquinol-cytochrome c reductase cytochrome b subunit
LLFGCLLGDCYGQKRSNSTRFAFKQCSANVEYLMWFHEFLASRGYCSPNKPVLKKTIVKENKVYFYYRCQTYSYSSFNWIYDSFYLNGVKRVPENIQDYLTPFALAIWIMNDGRVDQSGLRLSTNCFQEKDVLLLVSILEKK